jgi:ABC-type polysaccharide/polyol phosphate export permease
VSSTISLVENAHLIKRVPVPREVIPIASVLSNCVQLGAQLALVLLMAFAMGVGANAQWKWLPVSWLFFIGFVCGLGLLSAALDVYVRDLRYVVGVRQSGAVLAGADLGMVSSRSRPSIERFTATIRRPW